MADGAFANVGPPGLVAMGLSPAELMVRCGLDAPEPWARDVLEARHPRVLMNCCRGSGKSTATAVAALHEVLFRPPALVLILSPSERQSMLMLRTVKGLYRRLGGAVAAERESATVLEFDSGRIESLPGASDQTIRGFQGVTLLIWDEMARLADAIIDATTPMVADHGRVIGLSTPAGMRGAFYRLFTGDFPGWHRVKLTGEESLRVSPRKLAEERSRMLPNVYAAEYMCSFAGSGDSIFPPDMVMAALSDDVAPYRPDRPRFV